MLIDHGADLHAPYGWYYAKGAYVIYAQPIALAIFFARLDSMVTLFEHGLSMEHDIKYLVQVEGDYRECILTAEELWSKSNYKVSG